MLICAVVATLLATSGCGLFSVKREVRVPPLLGPRAEATTPQLIAEVNRIASVRTIKGKVDIQFQDTSFAESGIAEKYRTADGTIYLQRPGQIYIKVQVPFVGTNIAEMTSDGQRFRIAILQGDEKYRRFVIGTNSANYPRFPANNPSGREPKNKMSDERTLNVLSNLRPQHFTDAFLIRPITPRAESGLFYAQSEFYQEEADTRPRAKKGARVVRGYYLLDEFSAGGEGGAQLLRRFWFDRVDGIRLARMQTYDAKGKLITDVIFGETKNIGEEGAQRLPSSVELTRPQDGYKLTVSYQSPESVVLDKPYEPSIFLLENKWQLPQVDLDERGGKP